MNGESFVFDRSMTAGVGMSAITFTGGGVGATGVGESTLGGTNVGTAAAGVVTADGPKFVSPVLPGMVMLPRVSSVGIPI
jgi:hypothetical protein